MAAKTEVQLILSAQNKASDELKKVSGDLQNMQGKTNAAGLSMGKLIGYLGGAVAAYSLIKKGIIDSVKAYEESENAVALLNATLASTGGVAGVTTKMATDLASSLQLVTKYSDEEIVSMEGILLTFTRINKDIFPQTTELVMDMATRMGGDLSGAAIQMGKALQDPILGMSALRRVGVNFSQSDKTLVTQMLATGKVMEAQKFILKELQTEFGGAARAAGKTFAGRLAILKNQINDVQEVMGKALIESLYGVIHGFDQSSQSALDLANNVKSSIAVWVPALISGFKAVAQTAVILVEKLVNLGQGIYYLMTAQFEKAADMGHSLYNTIDDVGTVWGQAAFESGAATDKILADFTQVGSGVPKQMGYASDAAATMSKSIEDATKKISDLKDEMKKAVASAKEDISNLKDDFKKQEISAQKDLGKSVADIIVQKQSDLKGVQDEFNKASTKDEKDTAQTKIKTIQDFLNAHLSDQQKYSSQILQAQQYAAMDEIQQLYAKYAEEKKQREQDYKDQLSDLKKHLKNVEKEYKNKLSDLRKELQKELGGITLTVDVSKSSSKKRRDFGGGVSAGQSYIVGEHRPEVFVPSQSGNIKQMSQAGGGKIEVNFYNPSVRNDNDLNDIIAAVKSSIERSQRMGLSGIRTI